MKKILMVDNYDSFTYNLVQLIGSLKQNVEIITNDYPDYPKLLNSRNISAVILSPGPGNPNDAGICKDIVLGWGGKIPMLGVCLGMQVIASCFKASIKKLTPPRHGKKTSVYHTGKNLFTGLSQGFTAAQYHSLQVVLDSSSQELKQTAKNENDVVMGIEHKSLANLYGIQFHPESFMSESGFKLMENFFAISSKDS